MTMLKSHHADILHKPYSQIKDLKLYCPEQLDTIKQNHQQVWQIFKAFILNIYQNLPNDFAKPHIENWCNGWQIRNHYFAYFKYQKYLQNAPIIAVILNKNRLMIQLDWHAYKAKISKSTVFDFNQWLNVIDPVLFKEFYYYHCQTLEYDTFIGMNEFCPDVKLSGDDWYKLSAVIEKDALDKFTNDELMTWATDTIIKLSTIYENCHGNL